jgi:hypothetical protein
LSDFSKEFYHWLAVSGNEAQQWDIRYSLYPHYNAKILNLLIFINDLLAS